MRDLKDRLWLLWYVARAHRYSIYDVLSIAREAERGAILERTFDDPFSCYLIRVDDGQVYGDVRDFDSVESALSAVQDGIARTCSCHPSELAPLEYEVDPHNREVMIPMTRNGYYVIHPRLDGGGIHA